MFLNKIACILLFKKKEKLAALTVATILKSEHYYRFPCRLRNQNLNLRKWALTFSPLEVHSL